MAPIPRGHGLSWVEAVAQSLAPSVFPCCAGWASRAGLESHPELVGPGRRPLFLAPVWVALRVAVSAGSGRGPGVPEEVTVVLLKA